MDTIFGEEREPVSVSSSFLSWLNFLLFFPPTPTPTHHAPIPPTPAPSSSTMRSLPFSLLGLGLITLCTAKDGTTTETTDGLSTSITGSSSSFNWSDASTITSGSQPIPTGSYLTYTSVITLDNGDHKTVTSSSLNGSTTATGNQTQFFTSTSDSVTVLVGGGTTTTLHSNSTMNSTRTHSTTSSTPTQTNTTPCNGYSEFCMRNYSNITNVAAHNSPFVVPGNAASNQAFKVTDQLNDGIRMRKFFIFSTPTITTLEPFL